uniref:ATP synthase subunit a n=1 Tax=Mukaria splendida TaxID=2586309 RepID=A0A7L8ZUP7_9HEMI|nr:ATP synthase F0 subunit 6 [Mukaria splendida]QOI73919.1 ATP synthase F0 subunit 6 [Mukaria splendida]
MNLFSVFDPSTGWISLNWLSMFMILKVLPNAFWNTPNKIMTLVIKCNSMISKEMIMHTKMKEPLIIMMSVFMFIMINNLMGLLPYVFTASSHLSFSLSIALTMWLSMMLYGWKNKTNHMFSHLVPIGTPYLLMPFMIMIETISNFIRPGSLAVRLTANMIAGHLLMTLLGNNSNMFVLTMFMWVFMILIMFEMAVAIIQSYVFMTLSTLYSSEV